MFCTTNSCQNIRLSTCIGNILINTNTFPEFHVHNSHSHPQPLCEMFVTLLPSGVLLNRGENFRMKCICSTALGGRCLWFASQDGDFWTTATVRQRQPARGLSVFKAKGSLSLTVSVCRYSHISRDGTSRSCCSYIVYICKHTNVIIALNSTHHNTEATYA